MKHTEQELQILKEEVKEMWQVVITQLEKSKQSLLNGEIELAREIISREKRVDAFELKIESDCENYIALYNPVAIDLRLVLSLMKISITLERIGDFAEGIARYVIDNDCNSLDSKLIVELQIEKMFDLALDMITDCLAALEADNTSITGKILAKDDEIDKIYHNALKVLSNYLKDNTQLIYCGLKLLLIIRKLERIGDHCSNIIEEIVFYIDAKVLKHSGRQAK